MSQWKHPEASWKIFLHSEAQMPNECGGTLSRFGTNIVVPIAVQQKT